MTARMRLTGNCILEKIYKLSAVRDTFKKANGSRKTEGQALTPASPPKRPFEHFQQKRFESQQ
jgi:hypothetical protein